jgi:hypothetical protein
MTFGLKNADTTYQRAMNYIFHDLIDKLVEIYIDDVMVKSASVEGHLGDVRQVLERTRRLGLKMNPKKCAFDVSAGQFQRRSSSSSLARSTLSEGLFPISPGGLSLLWSW